MKAIEARARHEAKARQQSASTSHVLLVMLHRQGESAQLMQAAGLRETDLLCALKAVEAEQTSTVERSFERANQLAQSLRHPETSELHLLAVMLSDTRSHARRILQRVGVDLEGLRIWVSQRLGIVNEGPREAPPAPSRGTSPTLQRAPTPAAPRSPSFPPSRAPIRTAVVRTARPMRPTPASQPAQPSPVDPSPRTETPVATNPEPTQPRNVRVARRDAGADTAEARELGPFDLDPSQYPLLTQLGRNLTAYAAEGRIDRVIGREVEVDRLLDVLARRRSNNPVLVGPPGVGKTAVVEALAHALVSGHGTHAGLEGRIIIEISAGALASGTGVRGALADKLRKLRAEVAKSGGRVVLFLDEIHTLVGGGNEGPDDLASELKASLARGELPCIGATTDAEYRKYFERDAALARRFSPVLVDEPTPEATIEMLHAAISAYETHHRVRYERDAIETAVELTVRFVTDRRLPDKAISALDHAGARVGRRGGTTVARRDVAEVVAQIARVPAERLLVRDRERLLGLESLLEDRVVGHAAELARISDALRKGAAGFRGRRPLATFLFLGPTGVGKTETAKAISDVFFAGSPMTRIDMSEFAESHAIARLLGAPPGYLGHDDGGQLTEAVRKRPYQLVLLDEIEKAHPEVLLALLPLLDEGRLTDGRGRTVDFTNTVIVLTSNLGAVASEVKASRIGFGDRAAEPRRDAAEKAVEAARRSLPPELWNRIDEPLWFGALSRQDVEEIARRMLDSVASTLMREHGAELRVLSSAVDALVAAGGFDPSLGARPMRRVVGRLVESKLASMLLDGSIPRGSIVEIGGREDRIEVDVSTSVVDAAE